MPEEPELQGAGQQPLSKDGHLRLTPEEVLDNWRHRLYTPAGYLYHLVLALRREGWWYRVENVSQFCRNWEINRRTFYRAKAELVLLNLLEEHISGSIDLRVSKVSQIDSPVSDLALPVTDLAQRVTDLSQVSPETRSGQGLQKPTDLSQISYRSNQREREGDEFFTGQPEPYQASKPSSESSASATSAFDGSTATAKPLQEKRSAAEADPEFFEWVVAHKIPKLPKPPASPRCAAESWINKQRGQLYAEYQNWLRRQQKGSTGDHSQPPPPPASEALYESLPERLERLRRLWQVEAHRKGICKAIKDNPHWGFVIGPDGPQERSRAHDPR